MKVRKFKVNRTRVEGVTLHHLPRVSDSRGSLCFGEFQEDIPFLVKRYFIVTDVPYGVVRGEHAHYECHQFLVCVNGSVSVVADDGVNREEFILDQPDRGVYLPPMIWGVQHSYSSDAVLLVFASHHYDAGDYVQGYDRFLECVNRSG